MMKFPRGVVSAHFTTLLDDAFFDKKFKMSAAENWLDWRKSISSICLQSKSH